MKKWNEIREWSKAGKACAVKVKRSDNVLHGHGSGPWQWCIYLYLYPAHPAFPLVDQAGSMSQDLFDELPLHGGCTYFRTHLYGPAEVPWKHEGTASVEIGCDYSHLHDDDYTRDEDGAAVFADAEALLAFASDWRREPDEAAKEGAK